MVPQIVEADAGLMFDELVEGQFREIREKAPDALGFGYETRDWFMLKRGGELAAASDPRISLRLAAEAHDLRNTPLVRLTMLHVLGHRADASVDELLIKALADELLRPYAAFQLGRANTRGYPERDRDRTAALVALAPYLDDPTSFVEPWWQHRLRTQDFVIAAFIRIAGSEHFTDPALRRDVGLSDPTFSDAERISLLAQCRKLKAP